ncbi:hypothetical protein [Nocardia cyriacigeorgica]|uniref:hypothetical protein n=1 Tax=Nocardia cyriacigeorgica TaxID=135487 RepID=UPI001893275B|nr:hypothetical protein [Nocardia cyriacigeorgica]MBF6162166.1 hypothetical protein [Nocardia cyriacigeorgica]MBF6200772.1 hypothetical protein [Nocardia cyriacigeorgica]
MSDINDTEHQPTDGAAEAEQQQPAGEPEAEAGIDHGNDRPSRQAAGYRVRLRAVEGERDQLKQQLEATRATVEALQRQIVDDLVQRDGRVKSRALWSTVGVADLLGDDGAVDTNKVAAAIAKTEDELGGVAGPRTPAPNPFQHSNHDGRAELSFADAFGPPRR